MASEIVELSNGARLRALRDLDVFHPWSSIDDERFCRRCGETISGRQILIYRHGPDGRPARLECPTKGCLAVPLDWIIVEGDAKPGGDLAAAAQSPAEPGKARRKAEGEPGRFVSSRVFSFLRAPRILF